MSRIRVTYSHYIEDETLYIPVRYVDKEDKKIVGFTIIMFFNEQSYVCDGLKKANGECYKIGSIYNKKPTLKGSKLMSRSLWAMADRISKNEGKPIDTIVLYQEDSPNKVYGRLYRFYRCCPEIF